jgi:hypothetical protein
MFNHQFRQSLGQMERSIQAFYDGIKHKPDTMFGNVKADVPADGALTNAEVSGRCATSVNLAKASASP